MAPKKKMTEEERKRRKRECERRRRENIKNDSELYKIEQLKKHERYEKAKNKGIVKLKKVMSWRELKSIRKKWKNNSQNYRNRQKFLANLDNNTPPASDNECQADLENWAPNLQNPIDNNTASTSSGTTTNLSCSCSCSENIPLSRQKIRGRKNLKRNRSRSFRLLQKMGQENKSLKTKLEN